MTQLAILLLKPKGAKVNSQAYIIKSSVILTSVMGLLRCFVLCLQTRSPTLLQMPSIDSENKSTQNGW